MPLQLSFRTLHGDSLVADRLCLRPVGFLSDLCLWAATDSMSLLPLLGRFAGMIHLGEVLLTLAVLEVIQSKMTVSTANLAEVALVEMAQSLERPSGRHLAPWSAQLLERDPTVQRPCRAHHSLLLSFHFPARLCGYQGGLQQDLLYCNRHPFGGSLRINRFWFVKHIYIRGMSVKRSW